MSSGRVGGATLPQYDSSVRCPPRHPSSVKPTRSVT
ncbi:hypothetical protein GGD62_003549 [Bradyrhizobium sp. ERR14]|nr:hypothetical protein [Bradyrhizobium sp. ERR14]